MIEESKAKAADKIIKRVTELREGYDKLCVSRRRAVIDMEDKRRKHQIAAMPIRKEAEDRIAALPSFDAVIASEQVYVNLDQQCSKLNTEIAQMVSRYGCYLDVARLEPVCPPGTKVLYRSGREGGIETEIFGYTETRVKIKDPLTGRILSVLPNRINRLPISE